MKTRTRGFRIAYAGALLVLLAPALSPAKAYPRRITFERVDIGTDGRARDGSVVGITSAISNGRFVAFETDQPLQPNDLNQAKDIYVRDVAKGRTELISASASGLPAVGAAHPADFSRYAAITPDGRFVAFDSEGVNLVPGDTNGLRDVFIVDRNKGTIERVSVSTEGEEPKGVPLLTGSYSPSISDNGRYVSFTSNAGNLVKGDTNGGPDIFVRDRTTDRTIRASVDSNGNEVETCRRLGPNGELPNAACLLVGGDIAFSSISASGRYVAFDSRAGDLVEGDTNRTWDVFVRDLKTKKTERVSVASDGTEAIDPFGPGYSGWDGSLLSGYAANKPQHSMSADGRYVVFASLAGNLVPSDTNRIGKTYGFRGGQDVFVHDRTTGRTERISVNSHGGELHLGVTVNIGSDMPNISANGRLIGFHCVCGADLAVHDRFSGALIHVNPGEDDPRGFWTDFSPSGRYLSFTIGSDRKGFWRADVGDPMGVVRLSSAAIALRLGTAPTVAMLSDAGDDAIVPAPEAEIVGGSLAYRPRLGDLFVKIDVERMRRVGVGIGGISAGPDGPLVYGARFEIDDRSYELRVRRLGLAATGGASFTLFECSPGTCSAVSELKGGYGTVGESVVAAIPLEHLGDAARLTQLEVFAGVGSDVTGALEIVDRARLGP